VTERKKLMVVGAGGFGQEIIWAARNINNVAPTYEIMGYCDDTASKQGQELYGHTILGTPEEVDKTLSEKPCFVCGIGDNSARARVVERLLKLGWSPVTIMDPSVIVAEYATVGVGTYVGAGSIISPYARVGNHVIINHGCSIGHDSVLGDFVQISPGGRVSGGCVIGAGATLGSNAVVAPLKKVGEDAVLGAASFAVTDIPEKVTAMGNPARVLMRRK
jgi:sugar O-acyltransferase (sialic acid O-acetyltransferase NeuD family)